MNNRLLFRAWDKKRKRMYEVLDLHKDPFQGFWATVKGFDIIGQKDIHIQIQPKDCVLMQCTGLLAAKSYRGEKDEDRLIFEGDIVKLWDGVLYEIIFRNSKACFWAYHDAEDNCSVAGLGELNVEIIGTVYDTPEGSGNHERDISQ